MRKFKFIGTEREADEYWGVKPVVGKVYNGSDIIGSIGVTVEEEQVEQPNPFISKLHIVLTDIENMLVSKNKKYGNSALEPIRLFSSASPTEQLKVRIDDKLSRLKTSHIEEDEDVLDDLIGYLILLKMSCHA